MITTPPPRDLVRTMLAVLLIGSLIVTCFWIMRPFLPSVVWAAMIAVASWPLFLRMQRILWGKRSLAVAIMTMAFLMLFVVPLWLAVTTVVDSADQIAAGWKSLAGFKMPTQPEWLNKVPLVGERLTQGWQRLAGFSADELTARFSPYIGKILRWCMNQAGGVTMMMVQFLLTVVVAAILFSKGEVAAAGVSRFAYRIAGIRGMDAADLAGKAIRAVALGIVVTAIIQSSLAGLGLWITGMPYAGLLTAAIFILVIAQLGPALVLVPAVAWLFWKGDPTWATVLLIWTIIVGVLDNFLRPLLIKKGADLPILLIFVGVVGGLIAFGVIGIFVGPVVLAVSYTLLAAWVADNDPERMIPDPSPAEGSLNGVSPNHTGSGTDSR
ncbi:conserved membrane hypothetical protein [uncultured Desulfobacterium sp.]|uniref:Permease n=1 Tax=uncultured Desulfobacterium sp. TaxID=201089 RepID=A0A445MZG8_9BACT|nr:conserved membrane hypothetical protein [uncultured Desulfobacterium sp.]